MSHRGTIYVGLIAHVRMMSSSRSDITLKAQFHSKRNIPVVRTETFPHTPPHAPTVSVSPHRVPGQVPYQMETAFPPSAWDGVFQRMAEADSHDAMQDALAEYLIWARRSPPGTGVTRDGFWVLMSRLIVAPD